MEKGKEGMKTTFEDLFAAFSPQAIRDIYQVMQEEIQDYKLTQEMRKEAAEKLGVDAETANGWKNAADILKHFDTVELAQRHPDEAGNTLKIIAAILAVAVPPSVLITGTVSALPKEMTAKIVEFSGYLTPEHIMNGIAAHFSKKKKQKS